MTTAFDGKVALVTGAGGGIGLATAEAFAKAGASVIVADRDEETIGKAAEGLRAAGHNAIGVTCDGDGYRSGRGNGLQKRSSPGIPAITNSNA